jgi:hypothetical protein
MRATFSLRFLLLTFAAVACGLAMYSYSRGLHETNNDFDVAIIGEGYFQVIEKGDDSESMTYYTRSGKLSIDSEGQLCLRDHDRRWVIEPHINVPDDWTEFVVRRNGEISVFVKGKRYSESIGQLQIAKFENERALTQERGLCLANHASGTPTLFEAGENGNAILQQRWLDESHRAGNPKSAAIVFGLGMLIAAALEWRDRRRASKLLAMRPTRKENSKIKSDNRTQSLGVAQYL